MPKPSLLILDFSYTKASGHHHSLNQLISSAAAAKGFTHRVLSSRYIDQNLVLPGVTPTFRSGVYLPVSTKKELDGKHRKIVWTTLVDLALSGIQIWGRQADIIIHTATASHLIAVTKFLSAFRFKGRINFFLMFPPDFDVPQNLTPEQEALYIEAQRIALASGLDIRFWCENLALRQVYRGIGIQSAQFTSLPSDLPSEQPRPLTTRDSPYTALFIGDPRSDKGFKILIDALPLMKVERPALKIRLQLTSLSEELLAHIEPYRVIGLVDLEVHRFIENERYYAELSNADVCVLPYHPVEYAVKNSNIVSESLGCGTPVIVPPGENSLTAYCQQFKPAPYVEMGTYTPEGLAVAIHTAAVRNDTLCNAAASAMTTVRKLRDPANFISVMCSPI